MKPEVVSGWEFCRDVTKWVDGVLWILCPECERWDCDCAKRANGFGGGGQGGSGHGRGKPGRARRRDIW